jgi:hypothetical protein
MMLVMENPHFACWVLSPGHLDDDSPEITPDPNAKLSGWLHFLLIPAPWPRFFASDLSLFSHPVNPTAFPSSLPVPPLLLKSRFWQDGLRRCL